MLHEYIADSKSVNGYYLERSKRKQCDKILTDFVGVDSVLWSPARKEFSIFTKKRVNFPFKITDLTYKGFNCAFCNAIVESLEKMEILGWTPGGYKFDDVACAKCSKKHLHNNGGKTDACIRKGHSKYLKVGRG